MSDLQEIKNRIYEENKIPQILAMLGCWNIDKEQGGKLYVAGLPDGDNPRSVQIKNNKSLTSAIRSKSINGSIYDVVSYIEFGADTKEKLESALPKSKYWICEKLEYFEYIDEFYKETSDFVSKKEYNSWLKKLKKQTQIEFDKNKVVSKNVLSNYPIIPYYEWYKEGLSLSTQKLFGVSIDIQSDRIVFPIHDKEGNIVGIKGRYCGRNKEIEDKYKYLYIYPCNKSLELFNYHRALPHIQSKKEVIIVEGAKTTMFLTQWGYKNCVSIEGDSLSDTQLDLLKNLGLDIEYVFVYDKDKDKKFVKTEADRLKGRSKYSIYDTKNLLEGKDSPTDKGKKVWDELYNSCKYKLK